MSNCTKESYNGLSYFFKIFFLQIKKPSCHIVFWCYFIIGIIIFGGIGIWYELMLSPINTNSLISSIILFVPPLLSTSILQLLLYDNNIVVKQVKTLTASAGIILVLLTLFLLIKRENLSTCILALLIFISLFFTILIVWFVSSYNESVYDYIDPEESIGGDISQRLEGEINDAYKI